MMRFKGGKKKAKRNVDGKMRNKITKVKIVCKQTLSLRQLEAIC